MRSQWWAEEDNAEARAVELLSTPADSNNFVQIGKADYEELQRVSHATVAKILAGERGE